jgi:predicted transcriptional regulator
MDEHDSLVSFTTQIVSAHVANNPVSPDQLPDLIQKVHESLGAVLRKQALPAQVTLTPAVPIAKSTRPDAVYCLECGKPFKMLKRHLMTDHKLTPDTYRQKWDLPHSYAMVSATYAKTRSSLAKQIGLGTKPRDGTARTSGRKMAGRKRKVA